MQRLLYVSSAKTLFTKSELVDLLTLARERNAKRGITGMLLYKEGNFMQVLEGEDSAVDEVFNRIQKDPRHRGVIVLVREAISAREYPDWSMGFRELHDEDIRRTPGFNEFINRPLTDITQASQSVTLLRVFRANM